MPSQPPFEQDRTIGQQATQAISSIRSSQAMHSGAFTDANKRAVFSKHPRHGRPSEHWGPWGPHEDHQHPKRTACGSRNQQRPVRRWPGMLKVQREHLKTPQSSAQQKCSRGSTSVDKVQTCSNHLALLHAISNMPKLHYRCFAFYCFVFKS